MHSNAELITQIDFDRLSTLVDGKPASSAVTFLDDKLARAEIIEPDEAPADLVTMNTRLLGLLSEDRDDANSERRVITLVYPHAADIEAGCISVFAPLGAEILGARAGRTVFWRGLDGARRSILIESVLYQPEANGHWHL